MRSGESAQSALFVLIVELTLADYVGKKSPPAYDLSPRGHTGYNYYKIGFNKLASSLISKGYITEFIKSKNYKLWINEIFKSNKNFSLTENLFFNDMEFFLPNSRCLTNDVASMRHSVELRGSFLDIEMLKIILMVTKIIFIVQSHLM